MEKNVLDSQRTPGPAEVFHVVRIATRKIPQVPRVQSAGGVGKSSPTSPIWIWRANGSEVGIYPEVHYTNTDLYKSPVRITAVCKYIVH